MYAKGRRPPTYRLDEWLVHGYLNYRFRKGQGSTIAELERQLGLHHKTVRATLITLESLNLIERKRNIWKAKPLSAADFARRPAKKLTKEINDRFSTVIIRQMPRPGAKIGENRFSLRLAFTYWIIASYHRQKKNEAGFWTCSNAGIRTMIGIDKLTVENYLATLERGGLIEWLKNGYQYKVKVKPATPELFRLEGDAMPTEQPVSPKVTPMPEPTDYSFLYTADYQTNEYDCLIADTTDPLDPLLDATCVESYEDVVARIMNQSAKRTQARWKARPTQQMVEADYLKRQCWQEDEDE
jgi:hypothetical protein